MKLFAKEALSVDICFTLRNNLVIGQYEKKISLGYKQKEIFYTGCQKM